MYIYRYIGNYIHYIFILLSSGDPSMSLKQLEPLKFESVRIQQGQGSPVKLDLEFTNSFIIGLTTATVTKVK